MNNPVCNENKIFLYAHSSGTTGNVKFIPISYKEYQKRVDNNFDIQFDQAQYGVNDDYLPFV